LDLEVRAEIQAAGTPGRAKRMGRKAPLREDWEEIRVSVMTDLVRQKFSLPGLQRRLLATGDQEIVEGNTWGDVFWGVCRGKGQNQMGKILMKIREELEQERNEDEVSIVSVDP
jgi:ribA/ribD-fused uncharacterized protein